MLQIINIRVRSFDLDFLEISWEVADTFEDIFDYYFRVLRSEGPAGPFQPITFRFENIFTFRDVEANQLSKHRTWYYKIRVIKKTDTTITQDFPTDVTGVGQIAEPDLEALEIARRMKLLLKEFTGRKVWIFPVRTSGQKCSCFDENTGRRLRSQCLTCFDTNYVGGFYAPIQTYMQIDPVGKGVRMTEIAEIQGGDTSGRLSNWPLLKPRDVVIEAENKRWRVTNVRTTEKLRSVVHQEIVMHEIPRTDIEYRLPVDTILSGHDPSPERQFTNPQKL